MAQSSPDPLLIYRNGKWCYADRTGKIVIEPQVRAAEFFVYGIAPVKIGDKFGYIERNGSTTIPAQFEFAGNFRNGLAYVTIGKRTVQWDGSVAIVGLDGKQGYIDKTGKFVNEALCW